MAYFYSLFSEPPMSSTTSTHPLIDYRGNIIFNYFANIAMSGKSAVDANFSNSWDSQDYYINTNIPFIGFFNGNCQVPIGHKPFF